MSIQSDLFTLRTTQFREAKCIGLDPEMFFLGEEEEKRRRGELNAICNGCPVFDACRKDADTEGDSGFRAGTTHKERVKAMAKKTGRRIKGMNHLQSINEERLPRIKHLREQGLSNVDIAKSMNIKVHSVDRVVRIIKNREAA